MNTSQPTFDDILAFSKEHMTLTEEIKWIMP
jgi:hypothetical protein